MTVPTEEQLKDPKWWEENAPTGASLYDKELRLWLKKDFFFDWLAWREDQQRWEKAGLIVDWDVRAPSMAARPVPPPAPERPSTVESQARTPAPTAEQLRDPKWWDRNAPTDAICYIECLTNPGAGFFATATLPLKNGDFAYDCKRMDHTWVEVNVAHWKKWNWPEEQPEQIKEEMPPASEWELTYQWDEGELPPVGVTQKDCELVGVEGFREGFEVVAHRGSAAIVWGPCRDDPEGQVETLLASHFRPIRTEEQRERERLAEVIRKEGVTDEVDAYQLATAIQVWIKEHSND